MVGINPRGRRVALPLDHNGPHHTPPCLLQARTHYHTHTYIIAFRLTLTTHIRVSFAYFSNLSLAWPKPALTDKVSNHMGFIIVVLRDWIVFSLYAPYRLFQSWYLASRCLTSIYVNLFMQTVIPRALLLLSFRLRFLLLNSHLVKLRTVVNFISNQISSFYLLPTLVHDFQI